MTYISNQQDHRACRQQIEADAKTIQGQAALIRKLGEALKKIANQTGQMPDEQAERDKIAVAVFNYEEWLKEQEGK